MNNSFKNHNANTTIDKNVFDWEIVQKELKNKLGLDIYESWIKKISLI